MILREFRFRGAVARLEYHLRGSVAGFYGRNAWDPLERWIRQLMYVVW